MAVTIYVPSAFTPGLPYDSADAANPNIKYRWAAAIIPDGPVSIWPSDLGTALNLTQPSVTAQPTRQSGGNAPTVVFDGGDTVISSYSGGTTTTVYTVFKYDAASGATQVMVALGGILIAIGSTGRCAIIGTSGSVQSVAALTTGVWYTAAVSINGGAIKLQVNGETLAGTIIAGVVDKIHLGASGSTAFFKGQLKEVRLYETTHTAEQMTSEMTQLKNWYGTS